MAKTKSATKAKTATPTKAKKAPAKKAVAAKATAVKAKAPKKVEAKTPTKAAAKSKAKAKGTSAFSRPLELSTELAAVLGTKPMARTEVVSGLWKYIKKENLQDPKNKRNINNDAKLKAVFGKPVVGMFEMGKLLGRHLK
jgi:upstream activation factor subunit UAF30